MEKNYYAYIGNTGNSYDFQHNNVRIPRSHHKAYEHVYTAKNMINNRVEKLQNEMDFLRGYGNYRRPLGYKINENNNLNPNLYSYQFIEKPHPQRAQPINGALSLPIIQVGAPMIPPEKNDDIGLAGLLALLMLMRKKPDPVAVPAPQIIYKEKTPPPIIPKKKTPLIRLKKDWWKFIRKFCNMHKYYIIANKYGKFSGVRDQLIKNYSKQIYTDLDSIKSWLIQIQKSFFDEFKVFPDMNLQFSNQSSSLKISEQSQKIIALLSIFLNNLLSNSANVNIIPEKIQRILYNYIRNRAYFPKGFLTTFEINRTDYNFYGGTKNNTDSVMGMLIALFIISRTFVHQILLHPIELFDEFKKFPYIQVNCKYIGSILHYITRDAFKTAPPMVKEILALFNFYRNYHIYNDQIEKDSDFFNNNIVYKDNDELSEDLVVEETISKFFEDNAKWCNSFKKHVFQWAVTVGKFIKAKYLKTDKNLDNKLAK